MRSDDLTTATARIGSAWPLVLVLLATAACTGQTDTPVPPTLKSGSALEVDAEFVTDEGTATYGEREYSFESDHMRLSGVPHEEVVNGFLAAVVPGELPVDVANNLNVPAQLVSYASEGWATANDDLVSVMAPAVFTMSDGVQYEYWLSATMQTASANQVLIGDIFEGAAEESPADLAAAAQDAVQSAEDPCFTDALDTAYDDEDSWRRWYRYSRFVLLEDGIRFGFDAGEVAPTACGTLSVLVSWTVVEPHLNDLGRNLRDTLADI